MSMDAFKSRVRLDLFDAKRGFSRGRSTAVFALWYLLKCVFFLSPLPWPSEWRSILLRLFGATIGRKVYWKPRVNVYFPWKLTVGDYSSIGEEVSLINFEPIAIGAHCVVSQRAMLCSGNHDYSRTDMAYRNAPIMLADGVWIGAQAFVAPGVTIGAEGVVTACSMVNQSLPAGMVSAGNPCVPVRPRWHELTT